MYKDIFIKPENTITEALKKLDRTSEKVLLVTNEKDELIGALTDGDIRRYILRTGKIEGFVKDVYNPNPIFIYEDEIDETRIKEIMVGKKIELIPVLDRKKHVKTFITWTSFFGKKEIPYEKIDEDIPVVIMAGGKGTRMRPFTEVLPKPLIPVGNKTAVEYIIDQFKKFGIRRFILTLNYKGELIEAYFNGIEKDYSIDFVWEDDFYGTAGSLKLIQDRINSDFIVSNCDIIVRANMKKVLDFHRKNRAYLTSITSIQHYKIPYGVVNLTDGGKIDHIEEKPEYTFPINTGVYVLNKKALDYIPEKSFYDMPQLIDDLIKDKKDVYAYPVNESDYIDLGQWDEYRKALEKLVIV
ncbi:MULTISPECIES: sugar phosphate nucleotidyltransferase [Persephonella]|uniref:Nucleotidyl transferase n=1 Tax=Persephonella marina (strain DSM 14350 / EX-H1) TaxID=123214 RepID=C0QRU3_PERMH|nr:MULTISPECIES: sugar phosphate nucleotidyltransferase [Persephonella]ACO03916.1 nucleotidyl transferase [Persephonella marina EX-H1]